MPNETAERQQELVEIYQTLKDVIVKIENKYSPEYHEVTMDFPPTLGLEKLEFHRHTEEELIAIAEQQLAAKYADKTRVYQNRFAAKEQNIQYYISVLQAKHTKKLAEMLSAYEGDLVHLMHKIVNDGLLYSTVKNNATAHLLAEYEQKVAVENAAYSTREEAYDTKLQQIAAQRTQVEESLAEQKANDVAALVATLAEREERQQQAVDKYNNLVDEKEAKYQANCLRYLQYAIQAENNRAIAIAKLMIELGESGVNLRKKTEMLAYCRGFFINYTQEEVLFMLSLDSFLQEYLGELYSALVDWVNTSLVPN